MSIELEKADRETEQGVRSSGWIKAVPQGDGVYFSRLDEYDKEPTPIRVEGAALYEFGCEENLRRVHEQEEWEYLGPVSPSDTEELFRLRAEVAAQKRLLKVSQDLLIDVLDSRAAQRFSAIGLSRMKSHVEDLRELLNPKGLIASHDKQERG